MLLLSNILQDVCVKVSRIKQLARKGIIIAAIAIIMKSRSCGDRCSSNCCHEPGCQSIASLVDAHVYSQQCTILCQRKQHLCTHTFITLSASSQCSSSVCCAISLAPAYTLQLQQRGEYCTSVLS